jgi:glycosyltransferase involved in cell wall biosynthesis
VKIAFVIQRYGQEVMGGSELHGRMVAERLVRAGHDCTVYTTAAKDYVTWKNEYPEGEFILNGVVVKRHKVRKPREIEAFNAYSDWIFHHPHTAEDERRWMEEQGPASPDLIAAIEANADRHDRWVFFTYLYHNTYWGLRALGRRKATLVPTAHDEPALKLDLMREVFERPAAFLFNTAAEKAMLAARFDFSGKYQDIVGIGVDEPDPVSWAPYLARYEGLAPYVLYAGRVEPGKGCQELIDFFLQASGRFPRLRLVFIGKLLMKLPDHPRLHYAGFVSEEEKNAAMSRAVATVHPSRYESLCMAALESLAVRTPILVQEAAPPLKDHCLQGQAGLYYGSAAEFAETLEMLVADRRLKAALAENGRRYVRDRYSWPRVMEKYDILFRSLSPAE